MPGITSLNGQTNSSQSFSNDTNVKIQSASGLHTLTWSGLLSASRGGTGNSTYLPGQILIGNNNGGLTASTISAGNNISIFNGNGSISISALVPQVGIYSLNGLSSASQTLVSDINVSITSSGSSHVLGWTGLLPVTRGGTGLSVYTPNSVLYAKSSATLGNTGASNTNGAILTTPFAGSQPVFSNNLLGNYIVDGNLEVRGSLINSAKFNNYYNISEGSEISINLSTSSNVAMINSATGNWTFNLLNNNPKFNSITEFESIIVQGASAFLPTNLKINNVLQNVKWKSPLVASPNKIDNVKYSIYSISTSSYLVLGSLECFE